MNKELTNLQDLKSAFISHCKTLGCEDNFIKVCENKFDIIESALKEHQEYVKADIKICAGSLLTCQDDFETIWKEHKAFKSIKETNVDIHNFKEFLIKQDWTYEQYLDEENDPNTSGHQFAYKHLSKKEFDLLKEILK